MTEYVIVQPEHSKKVLFASEVADRLENEGIILIYNEEEVIGSVIVYNGRYVLTTIDDQATYMELSEVLEGYPSYTFKFIVNA